jgi:hypothetical protein
MILAYFTANFVTLMIISALIVMMAVNRKLKIPATQYFYVMMAVILLLTVLDFLNAFLAGELEQKPDFNPVRLRAVVDAVNYMLRPVVIMVEVLVIQPKQKNKWLFVIPTVVNTVWYATALFGSKLAFYIDENNGWQGGVLPIQLVYLVQLVYLILLTVYSVYFFGRGNRKTGTIIMIIVLAALLTTFLEHRNILTGYATTVTAFCVMLYYIYLASVYQQEISELFEEKELHIARQELLLLRGQIHSDFIFDSLSVIRSLAKTDKKASAAAIDSFSAYLRAHLYALRDDKPAAFQWDLDCLKAYLALMKITNNIDLELQCDLACTAFEVPLLLLESVADYFVWQNDPNGETLYLSTADEGDTVKVLLCTDKTPDEGVSASASKQLEAMRRRLEMQCGGILNADGATVIITLPKRITV